MSEHNDTKTDGSDRIPLELFDGFVECRVGECSHVERFFHPVVGLMKMQTHLEEEHGISEEEFIQSFEDCNSPSSDTDE